MISRVMAARGRSVVRGGLMGVFERGAKLQNRLEDIMVHEHLSRHFGWAARAFVLAFAVLVLPMAPGVIDPAADAGEKETSAAAVEKTPYPQIMETVPKIGATDVDPRARNHGHLRP